MLKPFSKDFINLLNDRIFISKVRDKYHFEESQYEEMLMVASDMSKRVRDDVEKGRAGWTHQLDFLMDQKLHDSANETVVCITLGEGLDRLQEEYREENSLLKEYMVEAIASELLMASYPKWNRQVKDSYNRSVRRYHFWGSEDKYPLEGIPEALRLTGNPIECNETYCLIPKKSVIFVAELSPVGEEAECAGVCTSCQNTSCDNRIKGNIMKDNPLDNLPDLRISYGLSQIFGGKT
ncbi:MAG: hypothetical protein HUJ70_05305 [Pseudobutyrivibrio sp.]|nr:hypothetical protein [Pseudobutyrivibrio sp.]